ncbi:MAG: DUF2110 family protein [Crenarchaeota archaeon]|nr:DUF2110 family protein [Thermoproteota archaeon]MCR8455147.1 DUF2110 family protein [Thermoproteota archaeon]MCR8501366.1 DUF2110 family protein [Thermoproteota archaeon]
MYVSLPDYSLKKALRAYLQGLLIGLNASIVDASKLNNRFTLVRIEGDDAEVAVRYLEKVFGRRIQYSDIVVEQEYSGRIMGVLGSDILTDIGTEEAMYVKINAVSLLSKILRKNPRRLEPKIDEIIRIAGLARNMPFVVKVVSMEENQVIGLPGRRTINMFRKWFRERLDRVVVTGVLRTHLDKVMRKTGLFKKIVRIDRIGFLEYAIVCRFDTFADEVANILRKSTAKCVSIFMPRKIRKLVEQLSIDKIS